MKQYYAEYRSKSVTVQAKNKSEARDKAAEALSLNWMQAKHVYVESVEA